MKVAALIPAAGVGTRMNTDEPKQFIEVGGKPILAHTLLRLCQSSVIDKIILIVHHSQIKRTQKSILDKYHISRPVNLVEGGNTRQESIINGFNHIQNKYDIVITHDGVRPFVTPKLINDVVHAAIMHGAAIAAICSTDTLKCVKNGFVEKAVARNNIYHVQTPQAFQFNILREAIDRANCDGFNGTDESTLVERMGLPIKVIEGSVLNLKVTTPDQINLCNAILKTKVALQDQ